MAARASKARRAFTGDATTARAMQAGKAAWWAASGLAARRLVRIDRGEGRPDVRSEAPPVSMAELRRAWLEAFAKDTADVEAGLYPYAEAPANPQRMFARLTDLFEDARAVDARRRRRAGTEARAEASSTAYPAYYRQNFHYQSGGWFTEASAQRYEAQVELLFSGAAGPMRRRALSLLARAWRDRDQRGLRVLDVACGSGAFLADLRASFPRALSLGLDLSRPYLKEARRRSGAAVVQANAERLPFADASLDAATCVYLFHELPPRVRPVVARELARVLKPGGVLAFADSAQAADAPGLKRLLDAFPALFHEPFFASYQEEDLPALFAEAGLRLEGHDSAFLTKALLLRKA